MKIENELRLENKRTKEVLLGLGDLVFLIDKSFNVVDYRQNRDLELLFTDPSAFIGKSLNNIGLSESDFKEFIGAINEAKAENRKADLEFSLLVNGKSEYYEGSISCIKNENGQLLESILIAKNVTEKKQATKVLHELSLVGSKTTDLTIITTPDGLVSWVNKAFEQHTGYNLKEVLGKKPQSVLHGPETDLTTSEKIINAFRNRLSFQDVIINYAKDGRKYWVEFRIDPVFDEVGMCSHFISIERDITKRKYEEQELIRTREILLETNRVGKIGGFNYDVATNKVSWTDVTREIHELPEDFEPTVETVVQFYKEGESRQKYFEMGTNAIQNGVPYDAELQIVTGKGNEIWVRAIGKVDFKDGVCNRLYGTFQDIDEMKKAEIAINEGAALLENLTSNVPGCLYQYVMDDDGSFSFPFVSEGIFGMTGIKAKEIKEKPNLIFEMIHPEDTSMVNDKIIHSFHTLEKWECEYRVILSSGDVKWFWAISSPERMSNGVVWYGFLRDVSQYKS